MIHQAGVLVSSLTSLTDKVHPRLTLGAPGNELEELSLGVKSLGEGEMKPAPVEALLNRPVLSLPSHLVHQARALFVHTSHVNASF